MDNAEDIHKKVWINKFNLIPNETIKVRNSWTPPGLSDERTISDETQISEGISFAFVESFSGISKTDSRFRTLNIETHFA